MHNFDKFHSTKHVICSTTLSSVQLLTSMGSYFKISQGKSFLVLFASTKTTKLAGNRWPKKAAGRGVPLIVVRKVSKRRLSLTDETLRRVYECQLKPSLASLTIRRFAWQWMGAPRLRRSVAPPEPPQQRPLQRAYVWWTLTPFTRPITIQKRAHEMKFSKRWPQTLWSCVFGGYHCPQTTGLKTETVHFVSRYDLHCCARVRRYSAKEEIKYDWGEDTRDHMSIIRSHWLPLAYIYGYALYGVKNLAYTNVRTMGPSHSHLIFDLI